MVNHWAWMGIGGGRITILAVGSLSLPSSPETPHFGDLFLEVREDPPKTYI
jgi:hypothetical protein